MQRKERRRRGRTTPCLRRITLCWMKYVTGPHRTPPDKRVSRRTNTAANQARDLRRNRISCGGKLGGGPLIAKPRSHSASKGLESYLDGIVQTVIACVIAPKRNYGADAIVL